MALRLPPRICAPDDDNDGGLDKFDNCPDEANPDQQDTDADDVGNECDNCPDDYNPDQTDSNGNGVGDVCDVPECACLGDLTGDGWRSPADVSALVSQLLPEASNSYWLIAEQGSCGELTGDGWLSPADVSAMVNQLLPHASNSYWLMCE